MANIFQAACGGVLSLELFNRVVANDLLSGSAIVDELICQFGIKPVADAVANLVLSEFGEAIKSVVDQQHMQDFAKDMIKISVDSFIESAQKEVELKCENAVKEALGSNAHDFSEMLAENLKNAMNETTEEGKEDKGSEGKGQSWFTILAKALGKIAGQHLDNMVKLQQKMTGLTGKDDAGKMAEAQAEFQAQSQMFKLASEAISTVLKSIGEGLSSLARKQ